MMPAELRRTASLSPGHAVPATAAGIAAMLLGAPALGSPDTLVLAPIRLGLASAAAAQDLSASAPADSTTAATGTQQGSSAAPGLVTPSLSFGAAGSSAWSMNTGVATAGGEVDVLGSLGYHYFLADGFEVNPFVGGWYHAQDGEDAASLSLSVHFRYHFIRREQWSMYGLVGIGGLFSTHEVPEGGTQFNFLPTFGAGFTHQLGNSRNRLDLGVRWQHISNGSFAGTDDNPDRDAAMFYAGVIFPF